MSKETTTVGLTGIAKHFVACGLLDTQIAEQITETALAQKSSFINQLIKQEVINPVTLAQETSNFYKLPFFDLDAYDVEYIPSDILHADVIQKHHALPLYIRDNVVYMAMTDPSLPTLSEINFLTGLTPQPVIVEAEKFHTLINNTLNSNGGSLMPDLTDTSLEDIDIGSWSDETDTPDDSELNVDSSPVVRFVNKILLDAISQKASDIHFEPYEKYYRIRFRQDGILREITNPPLKLANYLVTRLKVMSNLDISERRKPQDGRFQINISKTRSIYFRISTCPTLYGEKIVARILESSNELLDLDVLGMSEIQKQAFTQAIEQPQGIILVTGPTGSGKTVTLYTGLDMLNTSEVNISTVEDPVEIQLPGINQVQVNVKAGLTFASALRSFLRQDPNIIMVGEIRDLETAEIAVKASQTGHLVLSTLHTNSAAETLIRLSSMGLPAYNIASSVILIVAQRLARRLCNHCKQALDLPEQALIEAGFDPAETKSLNIYGPGQCSKCNKGYKGRVGIYEVLPISEDMQRLIMEGGHALDMVSQAQKENITMLRESALQKVREGLTSLDEINRVITD